MSFCRERQIPFGRFSRRGLFLSDPPPDMSSKPCSSAKPTFGPHCEHSVQRKADSLPGPNAKARWASPPLIGFHDPTVRPPSSKISLRQPIPRPPERLPDLALPFRFSTYASLSLVGVQIPPDCTDGETGRAGSDDFLISFATLRARLCVA